MARHWIYKGLLVALLTLVGSTGFAMELSAKWIWSDIEVKSPFQQVAFEKNFKLSSLPNKAEVYVTADTFYRLWINGSFVMHGPARSSARHATVDIVDIRKYLKAGENKVYAKALYGNHMFEALAQAPGFLCEIRLKNAAKSTTIASDSSWNACELTAWDRNSPKYAFQRGWVEDIDARKDVKLSWKPAIEIGNAGIDPWKIIEARDIPLPSTPKDIKPQKLVASMRSQTYVPDASSGDIPFAQGSSVLHSDHWVYRLEKEKVDIDTNAVSNANAVTQSGKGSAILHSENAQAVYDFGASFVGFVGFEVTGKAGQVIEVSWNEALSTNDNVPRPGEHDSSILAIRYVLRDGKQTFLTFSPYLVRFIRIVNRSGGDIELNKLYVKQYCFYAPSGKGDFACSDDSLNAIYETSKLTAKLNTLDAFLDCPSRERGAWLHDGYWTAQAIYAMYGDTSVNRRMCRQFAQSQDDPHFLGPDGMVPPLYPSSVASWPMIIPAHELFWILQVGLDNKFTGDLSYTRRLLPAVRRMLSAFDDSCNSFGLLEIPFKWQSDVQCWNFLDWADIKSDGVSVGLNAVYAVALDKAAELERLVGDPAKAKKYSNRADLIRSTIEKYCPGDGYYPDSLSSDGAGNLIPSKEMCESTQYFAMWSGISSKERTCKIWARLRDAFEPTPRSIVQPIDGLNRAGFYTFPERLEIAANLGDYSAILRDMKSMFLPMINSAPGTFWETPWANSSLCHGLGSFVAARLIDQTLGINLGLPIVISPKAVDGLSWCKGYITTPKGKVSAEWKLSADRFVIKSSLPKGESGSVTLPQEAKRIWSSRCAADEWPKSIAVKGTTSVTVTPGLVKIKQAK